MGITLRLLVTFAMVGLVAGQAQAHTIAVRGGGGSTDLCGEGGLLGDWVSLAAETEEFPDDGDPEGTESITNNCGDLIYSLDLQFSDEADGDPLSHLSEFPLVDADSIFDRIVQVGDVFRFFSSVGNAIDCDTCGIDLVGSDIVILSLIAPDFLFVVTPDLGDQVGFFRIADFGTEQIEVVPEPATLLLLGTGLAGVAVRRRRRADPRP